jgi:predicted nucleic acid-binding protein
MEMVKNIAQAARFALTVDNGEAEAIVLAKELHADRLLMDERKGRRLAVQEGLPVIGLLGVVILAKRRHLIPSARTLVQRLEQESGVYLSEDLRNQALRAVGE